MANQICEGGPDSNSAGREHEFIIYVGKHCPLCLSFDELEDEIVDGADEQYLLGERVEELREERDNLNYEVSELEEQINELQEQINELQEQINDFENGN